MTEHGDRATPQAPRGKGARRLAFAAYDAAVALLVWTVLAPAELLRAALGRSSRSTLAARLGWWTPRPARDGVRPLLVHGVSAGEVAAAGRLIAALSQRDPSLPIVLTTGTRDGRRVAEAVQRRLPAVRELSYLPWDRRRAVLAWLARIDPCAVVVVETEIWPALFRSAASLQIPVLVVNGRMDAGAARRYALARCFFRDVLDAAQWIGVQTAAHRESFITMGAAAARVEIAGDLKLDRQEGACELPAPWREAMEELSRRGELVVAGSTHRPEERWLVDSLRRLRTAGRGVRLILAPRHPRRARGVLQTAAAAGFRAALWSAGPSTDWEVLVVDELGPLAALYPWAEVAVIGGSIAGGGGHNPVEAAAAACPVIIGPFHEHVAHIVRGLEEAGGVRVLAADGRPADTLYRALAELLATPDLSLAMGARAAAYCTRQRGAADRYAAEILSRIASSDRASTGTAREICES